MAAQLHSGGSALGACCAACKRARHLRAIVCLAIYICRMLVHGALHLNFSSKAEHVRWILWFASSNFCVCEFGWRVRQGTFLDHTVDEVKYSDFINHELILFSRADLQRSIPGLLDGFKPGQRKILFAAFKRKLKSDLKVAQLAGYVAEHSAYHHGEASLMSTIVGLAQDFVGSNNVNVLMPSGQFGTRILGALQPHLDPGVRAQCSG